MAALRPLWIVVAVLALAPLAQADTYEGDGHADDTTLSGVAPVEPFATAGCQEPAAVLDRLDTSYDAATSTETFVLTVASPAGHASCPVGTMEANQIYYSVHLEVDKPDGSILTDAWLRLDTCKVATQQGTGFEAHCGWAHGVDATGKPWYRWVFPLFGAVPGQPGTPYDFRGLQARIDASSLLIDLYRIGVGTTMSWADHIVYNVTMPGGSASPAPIAPTPADSFGDPVGDQGMDLSGHTVGVDACEEPAGDLVEVGALVQQTTLDIIMQAAGTSTLATCGPIAEGFTAPEDGITMFDPSSHGVFIGRPGCQIVLPTGNSNVSCQHFASGAWSWYAIPVTGITSDGHSYDLRGKTYETQVTWETHGNAGLALADSAQGTLHI